MLDMFHTPRGISAQWSVFYGVASATTTDSWRTWAKPRGCSWVYMMLMGGGGGGGGGPSGAATRGGGGGGSTGMTRLWVPAACVPDMLYVRPGNPGIGGAAANSGTVGGTSYVSVQPTVVAANQFLTQVGGNFGISASTEGANTTVTAATAQAYGGLGVFVAVNGIGGATGSIVANGAAQSRAAPAATLPLVGGAGGGSGTAGGGSITAGGLVPVIAGGAGTTGGVGLPGFRCMQRMLLDTPSANFPPILYTGGSGGGGHVAGTGGAGGFGSWGCGGGGGGGTTNAAGVGGRGGDGGPGVILIGAG